MKESNVTEQMRSALNKMVRTEEALEKKSKREEEEEKQKSKKKVRKGESK